VSGRASEINPLENGCAFIDGDYVPLGEARIPILDWGLLHSDATYDVVHVWKGSFFRLEDHLDRFERSVAGMRLTSPLNRGDIRGTLMECVRKSGLRDAFVEMICTRGVAPSTSRDPRHAENRFYAFAAPFVWLANEEQRKRGLHLMVSSVRRIPPDSVDPRIKNYHWIDLTKGLFEAYDRGGENVVLTDGEGNVTEGPGFNVFCLESGVAVTPDSGVLEGITRRTALELCEEEGIETRTEPLSAERFRDADEVFITSTGGGIMPVTRVDDRILGNGVPGPITARLVDLYWAKQEAGWHGTPVDYPD
jgi:branched-chain amino acid aminotransferase